MPKKLTKAQRARMNASCREWRKLHPDYQSRWMKQHPGYWSDWVAKNRHRIAGYRAKQSARDRAFLRRQTPEFKKKRKAAFLRLLTDPRYRAWRKAESKARRAMERAMVKFLTPSERRSVVRFYFWLRTADTCLCHWCGQVVPKSLRSVDHVHPLSRGGAHRIENIVCACLRCNSMKSNLPAEEFLRRLRMLNGQASLHSAK
jgi:5-methylcytosine-specific restriction endonuclease McrA